MKAKKVVEKKVSRTRHTPEFKERALDLAEKLGVRKAAIDLEVGEALLHNWRAKPFKEQKSQHSEMARLKREVDQLKQENDFLKKVALSSIGHCNTRMKFIRRCRERQRFSRSGVESQRDFV